MQVASKWCVLNKFDEKVWIERPTGDLKFNNNESTKIVLSGLPDNCILWETSETYIISFPNKIKSIQFDIFNSLASNVKEIETPYWMKQIIELYNSQYFIPSGKWLTVYFKIGEEKIALSIPSGCCVEIIDLLAILDIKLLGTESFAPIMRRGAEGG